MTRCTHCHQIIAKRNGYWIHENSGHRFSNRPQQHLAAAEMK